MGTEMGAADPRPATRRRRPVPSMLTTRYLGRRSIRRREDHPRRGFRSPASANNEPLNRLKQSGEPWRRTKARRRRRPIIQRRRTTASPRTRARRIGRPLWRPRGVLLRAIKQRNLQHHSRHRMGVRLRIPTGLRRAMTRTMTQATAALTRLQRPRHNPNPRPSHR